MTARGRTFMTPAAIRLEQKLPNTNPERRGLRTVPSSAAAPLTFALSQSANAIQPHSGSHEVTS